MPGPLLLLQGQVTTPTVEFLLGKKKKKNLPPTLGVTDNYGLGPSDKTHLFTLFFFFQPHRRSAKLPFFSGEALLFFFVVLDSLSSDLSKHTRKLCFKRTSVTASVFIVFYQCETARATLRGARACPRALEAL